MNETWGQWLRRRVDAACSFGGDHFSILLLFSWVIFMMFYVMHIAHHSLDKDLLQWSRENTAGVIGALLGMLTGTKIGFEAARRQFQRKRKKP